MTSVAHPTHGVHYSTIVLRANAISSAIIPMCPGLYSTTGIAAVEGRMAKDPVSEQTLAQSMSQEIRRPAEAAYQMRPNRRQILRMEPRRRVSPSGRRCLQATRDEMPSVITGRPAKGWSLNSTAASGTSGTSGTGQDSTVHTPRSGRTGLSRYDRPNSGRVPMHVEDSSANTSEANPISMCKKQIAKTRELGLLSYF